MNISFNEAVTPEGKTTPETLAYLVMERAHVPKSGDVFKDIAGANSFVYDLTMEEEHFATWLVETEYQSIEEFRGACMNFLSKAFDHEGVVRCTLMFDGVYGGGVRGGSDSTIDFSIAEYIYGLRTKRSGPVMCMDLDVLRSAPWRNLIKFLGERD